MAGATSRLTDEQVDADRRPSAVASSAEGGIAPVDRQAIVSLVDDEETTRSCNSTVDAEVALPPAVVVVTRKLSRRARSFTPATWC